MSVTNEVRNSVKQSLQYSDVKALNLTTLPKRLFVQIFNNGERFYDNRLKPLHQFFALQTASCYKLCGSNAVIDLACDTGDAPLLKISCQMQQQVSDAVQLAARFVPDLVIVQLPNAMADLPHRFIKQMLKLQSNLRRQFAIRHNSVPPQLSRLLR